MSVQQLAFDYNGRSGDRGLAKWWGAAACTAGEQGASTFERMESSLGPRVLEVFSSVEPGIDGPHSGSDHRNGGPHAREGDRGERVPWKGKESPDLENSNRDSSYGRPKSEKQKYACDNLDRIGQAWC